MAGRQVAGRSRTILAEERHRVVLARLQDAGSVRVTSLARELAVTEETIRRDLERLDRDGKLIRIHGGAIPIENDRRDLPYRVRETVNLEQKRAIAAHAVRHIAKGDVIALDASTTAVELARVIPDVSLTVVTNSMVVAAVLVERTRVRVVSTGGILDAPSLSWLGSLSEQALERFRITKLFFSCNGVDPQRGLSVSADEHARIKRRMIDLAESAYLLVDAEKFGARAVEFFATVDELDLIVTDSAAPAEMLESLRRDGVQIEVAER